MLDKTLGAHQESVKTAVLVESFDTVEDTTNHIVTTRGLTARKDNTNVAWLITMHAGCILIFYKSEFGKTISVGEQSLDFLLVTCRFSCSTLNGNNWSLQSNRKFGLIRRT